MTINKIRSPIGRGLCGLLVTAGLLVLLGATAAADQTFEVLQIGARSYKNVTVTTKAKDYIFILHASGMVNIKVAELPRDVLQKLGYLAPDPVGGLDLAAAAPGGEATKIDFHQPRTWTRQNLAALPVMQSPQAKKWLEYGREQSASWSDKLRTGDPVFRYGVLGGLLLGYLLFCFGCMEICNKAGKPGGILVWVPILQWLPMLRAAGMSRWWFLAYPIPVFQLVAQINWSFEIAKALGKSAIVGLLLILPGLNIFAFLYLAFSEGKPEEPAPRLHRVLMTLETA
jgi:hypothetical protein